MLMSADSSWGLVSRRLRRQLSWDGVLGGEAHETSKGPFGELHGDWELSIVAEARDIGGRTESTPLLPHSSLETDTPRSLKLGYLGYFGSSFV